ncbi:helix-turn-helix transcriptional regulator [Puia sp.]|jgi:AraC-like DNA-binding protein|uniref:helix-turn-helix transcriptional regulator n=1 Tax=Puia sp. TaxID=2045100 RepID=UPI002F42EE92
MSIKPTASETESNQKEITLDIQSLQWLRENKNEDHLMPHRHEHIEIIWIKNGNGCLDIDLKKYRMGSNMLYCIVPGQLHQVELDETAEGYLISLPEHLMNGGNDDFELLYRSGLFHLLMRSPGMNMEPEVACEVDGIIRRLHKELYGGYLLRKEIIRRYTSIFLIYLARQFDGALQVSVQTKNVRLVKNFISLVEKKYMCCKLVKEYASELAVTPNYLNEIVKRISGYSAGYHIRQRVVLEARRKAAYSDVSMKEIAYHLGFDDIAHFSKFFKTVYGKNFTDFKKESISNFS